MENFPWACVLIGVPIVAGLIYLIAKAAKAHAERERLRKLGLARWASANGFTFAEQDPWNLDARYRGVGRIGTGHDRYAYEVLTRDQPAPCAIFGYHYKTWETRTVTRNGKSHTERYEETHWDRYLVCELGAQFPGFEIRPEGFLDRIGGFLGFGDINFESEEFSKRYHVKSDDRQFAYALVHPQMMEWLLPQAAFEASLHKGLLVMDLSATEHTPETCQQAWTQATGFVNRIPPFVWQDHGHRQPLTLPAPAAYVPPPPSDPAAVVPAR